MTAKQTTSIKERVRGRFGYGNTEWADSWCPWIRVAGVIVEDDEKSLEGLWASFVKHKEAKEMLRGLENLTEHFLSIAEMAGAALDRSRKTLERLGYSADNPRPDQRRN